MKKVLSRFSAVFLVLFTVSGCAVGVVGADYEVYGPSVYTVVPVRPYYCCSYPYHRHYWHHYR